MNTFKIYYDDETEQTTNANGTLAQFTKYIMQFGGRDVQENLVTGVETVRHIDQVGQVIWHVFADNHDEFYQQEDQANAAYDRLAKKHTNVRLYWEVDDGEGNSIEEDCIKSQGEYPL